MKTEVLLLTLITVYNVTGEWIPVKLRPMVLQPDLEAISNYYRNIDNSLKAFIYWPEAIMFCVRLIEEKSEKYVKIDGTFTFRKYGRTVSSYDGLYYRNNKFYVKIEYGLPIAEISPQGFLYYTEQPHVLKGKSFLSIRYFSLKEIVDRAKVKFGKKEDFYRVALPTNPGIFLLTPNGENHFLEYSFKSSDWKTTVPEVEGGLRVLVGNKLVGRRRVEETRTTSKILVDPDTFRVTIPDNIPGGGPFDFRGIFGVREGGVGFLAEHYGYKVRMLSNDDISGKNGNPNRHVVPTVDFLTKVKNVQPASSGLKHGFKSMPFFGKFQFHGHVLEKKLNYIKDTGMIDSECPFVIEFETEVPYFLFGTTEEPLKTVCTNEEVVWPMGQPRPTVGNNDITLVHPFARN